MKRFKDFNPISLKEARIVKGKSMTELASLLDIKRQSISSFEKGNIQPSFITIEKLSQILDKPIDYFYFKRNREILNKGIYSFRSLSRATAKERDSGKIKDKWLTDIYTYLEKYLDFPKIKLLDIKNDNFEALDQEAIEQIAIETRKYWGLDNNPISNIQLLLENNGIVTANISISTTLDAFSSWKTNDVPFILLSKNNYFGRHRFNLCHELGHLILHKSLDEELLKEKEVLKHLERQANRFASAFLMPKDTFLKDIYSFSIDSLVKVKKRWGASIQAIIYRLSDLEIIDKENEKYLNIRLSTLGYKRKEPLDMETEVESPVLIKKAVRFLADQDVLTPEQFLREINLSLTDVVELTGLDKTFFKRQELSNNIVTFKKKIK